MFGNTWCVSRPAGLSLWLSSCSCVRWELKTPSEVKWIQYQYYVLVSKSLTSSLVFIPRKYGVCLECVLFWGCWRPVGLWYKKNCLWQMVQLCPCDPVKRGGPCMFVGPMCRTHVGMVAMFITLNKRILTVPPGCHHLHNKRCTHISHTHLCCAEIYLYTLPCSLSLNTLLISVYFSFYFS